MALNDPLNEPTAVLLRRARLRRRHRPLWDRRTLAIRLALFAALVAGAVLAFPPRLSFTLNADVGDIWQGRDIVAPFDFPIRIPDDELARKRDSVRYVEPPIFVENPGAELQMTDAAETLRKQLADVFDAYAAWTQSRARGQVAQAAQDSARYYAARVASNLRLTPSQWALLLTPDAAAAPADATAPPGEAEGARLSALLMAQALDLGRYLLPRGVLDVPKDSVLALELVVRNERDRVERRLPRVAVIGYDEALSYAQNNLAERFRGQRDTVALGVAFFRHLLPPTLRYQADATQQAWTRAAEAISPVRGRVREGMVLLRRGDEVTPAVVAQLQSLERAQAQQRGAASPWRVTLGQTLMVTAAFLIFFLYLYLLRRPIFEQTRFLLLIALLLILPLAFFGLAVRLPGTLAYAVPIGLSSVLLTVLFDSRVGYFATVTLALLGGLIFGYDFEFAFATMFVGTVAVFSVRDIRNRSQFFLTSALVFGAYVMVLGSTALLRTAPAERLLAELGAVGLNALLLLLAYPLLWLFERVFRITTDLTLLELSDTNRPLLKELSLRAPGTFNHVLQVANLAEAAAAAVGANALLARVGALYHDVGKMMKPEYYVENQQGGLNPHDRTTPEMSASILASHVRDGLELAREYALPDVVLAFIPSHHGTALMEFFYSKAKSLRTPDEVAPLDEAPFRYPGPLPHTVEQGIVMLADSVEAASRSLQQPTAKRLEALIDALFRARFEDGQLSRTPLTFADLTRIKETFLILLNGIYHARIKYPDQDRITGEIDVTGSVPHAGAQDRDG